MMLDATAGNRMMWPNKSPPNVIFMDKEIGLRVSPDVFADFRYCPFRDKVFECIIFDPPFVWDIAPWFLKPSGTTSDAFFGTPGKRKRDLLVLIHQGQKEFQRLTDRLCLKWGELRLSLWKILPFFKDWKVINVLEYKGKHHSSRIKNKKSRKLPKTFWVTFVRRSR